MARPQTPRMAPEERKAALLDHTARLLVEDGARALTMEAVARRAGVNRALPYYYFDSKENLLVELFERNARRFDERVATAVDAADDFAGKMRGILDVWMNDLEENGAVLGALDVAKTESGDLEARRLARTVANGSRVGDLIANDFGLNAYDALIAAAAVMSAAQGLVAVWQAGGLAAEDIRERFVDFAIGGITALGARSENAPT